jgi:hypothetical protein
MLSIYDMSKNTQGPDRLQIAHGAFQSLHEVVQELKEEDGCDVVRHICKSFRRGSEPTYCML